MSQSSKFSRNYQSGSNVEVYQIKSKYIFPKHKTTHRGKEFVPDGVNIGLDLKKKSGGKAEFDAKNVYGPFGSFKALKIEVTKFDPGYNALGLIIDEVGKKPKKVSKF